tara:strand:- start:512 stop:916 length:405 start_codon:yes stop_codon:yes gene_type:complete
MKIDDSKIIRFINNDLSNTEIRKIKLLINNDFEIKARIQSLKNLKSALKKESKKNKKIKMPLRLSKRFNKQNINNNNFERFYKLAASFLAFISIGWIITTPNTALLSQNTSNYLNLLIISLLFFIIFLIINKKK